MDKKSVIEVLKLAKESSPKRNFKQSFDFIVNLKGLDLKKTENQVEFFMILKHPAGKKPQVCALVGPELLDEAKSTCDFTIVQDDFPKYSEDKKLTKKLAEKYDFFIAQANIMAKVASTFGRVLGPRGKMPNPKAGCVVPPKTNLKPLQDRLLHTVKISAKTVPIIQTAIGTEDSSEDALADNILNIYDQLIHHLPGEKNNIASMYVKLTMGKPIKLGDKTEAGIAREKKKPLLAKHDDHHNKEKKEAAA